MPSLKEWQKIVHDTARRSGWYDGELNEKSVLRITSMLCLFHSEVSEALEDLRAGNMELSYDEKGKPVGFPSELADIIIRVLDTAEWLGIDMDEMLQIKNRYNESRQYKHGNKAI